LKDQNSVFAMLQKDGLENKSRLISDLMGFLTGAADTTP